MVCLLFVTNPLDPLPAHSHSFGLEDTEEVEEESKDHEREREFPEGLRKARKVKVWGVGGSWAFAVVLARTSIARMRKAATRMV